MAISTNQKPTIYRNLYENTGPGLIFSRLLNNVCPDLRHVIGRNGHLDQSYGEDPLPAQCPNSLWDRF